MRGVGLVQSAGVRCFDWWTGQVVRARFVWEGVGGSGKRGKRQGSARASRAGDERERARRIPGGTSPEFFIEGPKKMPRDGPPTRGRRFFGAWDPSYKTGAGGEGGGREGREGEGKMV